MLRHLNYPKNIDINNQNNDKLFNETKMNKIDNKQNNKLI